MSIRLGDVAEFIRGITFKPDDVVADGTPGSIWCMRTKNVQSELDLSDTWSIDSSHVHREEQYLRPSDILVSSANSWNLVGKCCRVPHLTQEATFGGFISVLRAKPSAIDPRYLYRWFSSPKIQATVRNFGRQTTNISNLDFERCLKLRIPVPEILEQDRIAEILDQADELREKRKHAITLLDELAQSIFLDMFGDPVSNMHRWPVAILGDLLSGITSGRSPICLDRSAGDGEWGVLKLGAITKCVYLPSENKALPPDASPDERHEVRPGDVLFSRKNTRELVAASAFVEETPTRLLLPDLIFRFEIRDDALLGPRYLHRLLIQPSQRRKIQDLAGGSAASMLNISKGRLSRIEIPLPPGSLQREFSERIVMIEQQIKLYHADLWKLDHLFGSLQARAFRNEL